MVSEAIEFVQHPTHTHIALVALRGHITGGPQAVELSTQLSAFTAQGGRHAVVDLSGIELINSSGLGMLVSALTTLRKLGGSVKLVAVPKSAMHLLEITRLNTVFEILPTTEDAVQKAIA